MTRLRRDFGLAGLSAFAALLAWALAPILYLAVAAATSDRSFTGADGLFAADQLQYLAWIRSSGDHILAANGFDLGPGGHVFLHPMWLLSGLAWRAGVSIPLSYLLWVPVGAAVLAAGFWAYVRRTLPVGAARIAAVAVALFFVAPAQALYGWLDLTPAPAVRLFAAELSPAAVLWGYLPIVVTLGLMPLFLLGVERILDPARRAPGRSARWYGAWTAVAGLLASWLHPWQGETLLVIVGGLVLGTRAWRSIPRLAVPLTATVAPLVYYVALARWDPAWALGRAQSQVEPPSLVLLAVAVGPLAAFALAAPGVRDPDVQERMLRLWPLAAAVVYVASLYQGYAPHSLEGLSLPLAVLAVRGWQRLALPRPLAIAAVLAVTLPGLAFTADLERQTITADTQAFLLRPGETQALAFLERAPGPGGVLSSGKLAAAVPAFTGRRTWQGHLTWTPDFGLRQRQVARLFAGRLDGPRARAFVTQVGARYLLSDCTERRDLRPALGPLVRAKRRFGCASVYELVVAAQPALL